MGGLLEGLIAADLSEKHYVYGWADGVHLNIRLEDGAEAILHEIGQAATRETAETAFTLFLETCEAKHPQGGRVPG